MLGRTSRGTQYICQKKLSQQHIPKDLFGRHLKSQQNIQLIIVTTTTEKNRGKRMSADFLQPSFPHTVVCKREDNNAHRKQIY